MKAGKRRFAHPSRQSVAILVAATLGVVGLALVGLMAVGSSGRDRIAPDARVGGIDVGGMTPHQAYTALRRRFDAPLARPVVVRHGGKRFVLAPNVSGVRADIGAMVKHALASSRSGDVLGRGVRRLLGLVRPIREPLRIVYSTPAVAAFARRVARRIDHPARHADVEFTRRGLQRTPARSGLAVRERALVAAVGARLASGSRVRTVDAPTTITRRPRVTLRELAQRYRWLIGVNRPRKELRLYRHLRLVKRYPIAVGRIGLETTPGRYEIQTKVIDPPWIVPKKPWAGALAGRVIPPGDPDNPLKARWMGFYDGEGIHGTDDLASLGSAASHGCIRMSVPDVEQLFRRVPLHTPVFIV
jgi:hypothetical protein